MSTAVLQICDLENDGPNCSVVIASFHVFTDGLSKHIEEFNFSVR